MLWEERRGIIYRSRSSAGYFTSLCQEKHECTDACSSLRPHMIVSAVHEAGSCSGSRVDVSSYPRECLTVCLSFQACCVVKLQINGIDKCSGTFFDQACSQVYSLMKASAVHASTFHSGPYVDVSSHLREYLAARLSFQACCGRKAAY